MARAHILRGRFQSHHTGAGDGEPNKRLPGYAPIKLLRAWPLTVHKAGKTFAEKAAWDFVEKEKPNFTILTINPLMVFGPVVCHSSTFSTQTSLTLPWVNYLNSVDNLNTSNERIRDAVLGKFKDEIPYASIHIWIDVRDVAEAHVKAMGIQEAASKRFFVTTGYFSNKEICDIIRKNFPQYKDLPSESTPGGDFPEGGMLKVNNKRSVEVLGLKSRSLEECVVDTIKSLQSVGL